MEPLSLIVISAAVGGAAGKFVEKAWNVGEKWLAYYFKDHYPKAQEVAKRNSLEFLNELAQRVHKLEEETKDSRHIKQQIQSAFEDPDFSALLKDALIASSRTDSEDKQKILARIVAERLLAQSEGLVALTSTLACEAVKHLTPKQIRYLGVATFVYGVRPHTFPPPIPDEEIGEWYVKWLTQALSSLLPIEPLTDLDFTHLESVSCIQYQPFLGRDMKQVLSPRGETKYDWPFDDFVGNNTVGKQLNELWGGMQRITLTTTGQLIGIYVTDEINRTRTKISW